MTRAFSAAGMDWGLLAAAGVLTMIPGAIVIWFVRNNIAKGLRTWPGLINFNIDWMAWTWQTGLFFGLDRRMALVVLTLLAIYRPEKPRRGILGVPDHAGRPVSSSRCSAPRLSYIIYMRFGGNVLWYPFAAAIVFAVAMFRLA